MSYLMCLFWVVAPFDGEHVAVFCYDDGFPPAFDLVLKRDHQVTNVDLIPATGQVRGRGWLNCASQLSQLLIQVLGHIGDEAAAIGVDAADWKLRGDLSHFIRRYFQDVQLELLSGLDC